MKEDPSEAPLRATVCLFGPVHLKETADASGRCRFAPLAPGAYRVVVSAPGYEYGSPAGPVKLTLRGVGEALAAKFSLRHADSLPPESRLALWPSEIVQRGLRRISGTAHDGQSGSGVAKVEISVLRQEDRMSWNRQAWVPRAVWLPTKGTAKWVTDLGPIDWKPGFSYTIATRATDRAGNVEVPKARTAAPVAAPSLLSPPRGSTCREAGDTDNNGSLEITDAIFLLGWLFLGGPEPPPPGRPCGPDAPNPSSGDVTYLGCETYRNCP